MKNTIIAIVSILLICIILTFTLTSCNKQIFDFNYTFHEAVIMHTNGTEEVIKIKSWKDYEGEQLQITDENDHTYLVNSTYTILK